MTELPMFPLGSVLFPTMVLPLHIFEPRYRELVQDCLAGELEFGVCLIERGWEVGGGDARTDVGTVAQIVDAQQLEDGRWGIAAIGSRRIRVTAWLEDNPYPRAQVVDWKDDQPGSQLSAERDGALQILHRVLALQKELGIRTPETTRVDVDPTLASYQMAALSPTGPFDRQKLLAAHDTATRLRDLTEMLNESERDLRALGP